MQALLNILKSIPSEAWTALVTAILTSGLTLAGIWFTNRAANQRLKIQLEHDRKIKDSQQDGGPGWGVKP